MRSAITVAALVLALVGSGSAVAAPAANDAFANATTADLPFVDSVLLDGSTTEPGEPQACNAQQQTVWYSLPLAPGRSARIDLAGSDFGVVLNVWRSSGAGLGSLSFAGCLGFGGTLNVTGAAGVTYYVQAGSVGTGAARLALSMREIPPPANDDFGAASPIGPLPFFETVPMLSATTEPSEPLLSAGGSTFTGTAWWTFTAAESGQILITTLGCCGTTNVGVYTGEALSALTETTVFRSFGRISFRAVAGTTYRIQLGHGGGLFSSGELGVRVEVAPPPSPAAFFSPPNPSSFDVVFFSASGFDPAGFGFSSFAWDFGDGGVGDGQSVTHRFGRDGDYPVTLTVTTPDGRQASTTTTVSVRTHDVGIDRLAVPTTAASGQARTISVEVGSRFGDEQVTVQLWRGSAAGWQLVGTATQLVRSRAAPRTTFPFRYTFTPDDAAVGRVTFRAVASIVGARDALTDDNELIAPATRVR